MVHIPQRHLRLVLVICFLHYLQG